MAEYDPIQLEERLRAFPRKSLIQIPTPFYKLERLSRELSGPEIFIKRDDMTGLAFGGNKSRKLEYILPDILASAAEVVITWGGLQSNWCLQTAAAVRRFRLIPLLILFKTYDLPPEADGNLLLDNILGARIRIREAGEGKFVGERELEDALTGAIQEVREWGHEPYVVPVGGSMVGWSMTIPLGALAYVDAFVEIQKQNAQHNKPIDHVILATGSGSTQAGLAVAAKALGGRSKVLGISVIEEAEKFKRDVAAIARDTIKALKLDLTMEPEDILVLDDYIKEGYGIVNQEVSRAIRLLAETEGIFLDPVYTGKAMVALLDLVDKGKLTSDDRVVFLHTGGTPALFPNKHFLNELLKGIP
jgi:L-cysteate sulfo-lyase